MKPYDLSVVMPVYNEAEAIGPVLKKWMAMLDTLGIRYRIRAYNDGSKDATGKILSEVADASGGRVLAVDKPNSGHGPTILRGYREAAEDSDWVFQIDSDDEMGPDSFPELWAKRNDYDFLVGRRDGRRQPLARKVVSFVSRLCVRLFYGKGIWDVNTPYRLMRAEVFAPFYAQIPDDTFAPNVILSGLAARHRLRLLEIPVPQHDRTTGEVSIKKWKLLKAAARSFWQTIRFAFTSTPKWKACLLTVVVMAICVFLMNLFCVPAHDELAYASKGGWWSDVILDRINSFSDIIYQQKGEYLGGGAARVWLLGTVAFFAGFKLYLLFDILNTLVWFALLWLVLREGMQRRVSLGTYVFGAAVLWWLLWYAEACSMNASYSINYLWMAVATLVMMAAWRKGRAWWLIPLAFFFGWSNETFALPMIVALASGAVVRGVWERRFPLTRGQCLAWAAMVTGACFMCFAPAASARSGRLLGEDFLNRLVAGQLSMALYPWIALVALALVILLFRRKTWNALPRDVEWWIFVAAGYGLYSLAQEEGSMHMLYSALVGGSVLLVRHFRDVTWPRSVRLSVISFTLIWMLGATITQVQVGQDIKQMLEVYKADPQGVTYRPARNVFPFLFSVDIGPNTPDNYDRFAWECEGKVPMTILSPWLYETLYCNSQAFFTDVNTRQQGETWGNSRIPKTSVSLAPITDATVLPQMQTWNDKLPGRFRGKIFPQEAYFLNLPKEAMPLTLRNGQKVFLR